MTDLDEILGKNFGISHAEARRLIDQGGVRREDGTQIKNADEIEEGDVVRVGRNRVKKIEKENK
jgi:RNA-binding protein YlmH